MTIWKSVLTVFALLGSISLAHASPIILKDVTRFTPTGTNSPADYNSHGRGDVNKLDGVLDYVSWTHRFDFSPAAATILQATLSIKLVDDEADGFLCFWGCEVGAGIGEDGTWDIGEVDTGKYKYDLEVSSVADGTYSVLLGSLGGDFYIQKSILKIKYLPVPEPGTLALLGLGLVGLAAARRKNS